MQHELDFLSKWLILNRLKLNVSKMKCMVFHKDGLGPSVNLTVEGESIENIESFKFLGIVLDGSLSFRNHYRKLYDKLFKSCYVIRFLSKTLPTDCLCTLYFCIF